MADPFHAQRSGGGGGGVELVVGVGSPDSGSGKGVVGGGVELVDGGCVGLAVMRGDVDVELVVGPGKLVVGVGRGSGVVLGLGAGVVLIGAQPEVALSIVKE